MSAEPGRAAWRVSALDGGPRHHAFDAQVLAHEAGGPGYREEPHEGELPDVPFTLGAQSLPPAGSLAVQVRCVAPRAVR